MFSDCYTHHFIKEYLQYLTGHSYKILVKISVLTLLFHLCLCDCTSFSLFVDILYIQGRGVT